MSGAQLRAVDRALGPSLALPYRCEAKPTLGAPGPGALIVLFDLQVVSHGDWQVVAPIGELDLASVPQVRQLLVQHVAQGERRFVLDLAGIDFMDSAGLGLVVMVAKRIVAHGGELRLARPAAQVRGLFEMVGLDRLWPLHPSVEGAIAAVDGEAVGDEEPREPLVAERSGPTPGT